MVASSSSSAVSEKRSTKRTAKFTPGEALQILAQSVRYCQDAGIGVSVENLHEEGQVFGCIVLTGVVVRDGRLEFAINGTRAEALTTEEVD